MTLDHLGFICLSALLRNVRHVDVKGKSLDIQHPPAVRTGNLVPAFHALGSGGNSGGRSAAGIGAAAKSGAGAGGRSEAGFGDSKGSHPCGVATNRWPAEFAWIEP